MEGELCFWVNATRYSSASSSSLVSLSDSFPLDSENLTPCLWSLLEPPSSWSRPLVPRERWTSPFSCRRVVLACERPWTSQFTAMASKSLSPSTFATTVGRQCDGSG